MLRGDIKRLLKIVKSHVDYIEHNAKLLDIYKGNLSEHVADKMARSLSNEALRTAVERIAPINVLRRIIDKQSKIYAGGVTRQVVGGSVTDETTLSYLVQTMNVNELFSVWNSYFNLFKNSLIQPYLKRDGKPAVRVIPSDRFIPFSDDAIDPDNPTGHILLMGDYQQQNGKKTKLYFATDDQSYVFFTKNGDDVTLEIDPEAGDAVNPIGAVPFVYINRDRENIVPTADSDVLAMSLLIPILLTDINYAHMFQAFSIIYGINITDKGIKWGPNAFWTFESDAGEERKPELGTLTPSADIEKGLALVANEFALWLNTKGIKPGAIGEVNGSNFTSGISKIMDEMDTSEDRNEQIPFFVNGERQFWDLVLKRMLPYWQTRQNYTGITESFTVTAEVITTFSEQVPLVRRGQLLDEVIKEKREGFTTWDRAVKRLNPQMTNKEIEELKAEILEEKNANREQQESGEGTNQGESVSSDGTDGNVAS